MDPIPFVKEKHASQSYKGGVPYWLHLDRVAGILDLLMRKHGEFDGSVVTAAYLHDIIEDTSVDYDELVLYFGKQVADFVAELTNTGDDCLYAENMLAASEQARLVKLADLWDNMTTATRRINENGLAWTRDWFFPKIDAISELIVKTDFSKFHLSAEELKERVRLSKALLVREISNWS